MREIYIMRKKVVEPAIVKPKPYFSVPERFDFISQFVKLLAGGRINSFILTGDAGLGKSYTVTESLKQKGLKEDTVTDEGDFVVVKGYSTPKALFRLLFEHNGKVIVFDDCDQVFKDPIGSNILKAALDSADKRVITWGAEFPESEPLPNRFEFIGRVVFISNLQQKQFPQALLSRSMKVDLTLSTAEKIERINQVLESLQVEVEEKNEVMEFIDEYAEVASELSIRSALSILKLKRDIGDDTWKKLALYNFVN